MKKALVLGGNGFIGHHLARRLKSEGYWVRVVDIKEYEYGPNDYADEILIGDLRNEKFCEGSFITNTINEPCFDEVYLLAASMGGAGFVFSGENDAQILRDNLLIDVNCAELSRKYKIPKLFYSSSACCYNHLLQLDPNNPGLKEDMAYPAYPDSDYGFEKLMGERIFLAYHRNHGLNVRIARFHNIFGPEGTWRGGREKAPAAICRKVIQAKDSIEIWGPGTQTRSFLYIDECLEGIRRLMSSTFTGPVNIGSDEMVTINQLTEMAMSFENKVLQVNHIDGPTGVAGRNSDNNLIKEKLGWAPHRRLIDGLEKTYFWIKDQLKKGLK